MKIYSAGKADSSGKMDYGVVKGRYLGHGSGLVRTTSVLDIMRTMDKDAYAEYQRMGKNDDSGLSSLKYLTNWYASVVKKHPSMVDNYEKQSKEYVEKNVKEQKRDKTSIINWELKSEFWGF